MTKGTHRSRLGRLVQRGFTLIELMVVIAIICIIITLGAVGINAIQGADVDATGSILSGAMTYLSSRAVHDNKTYRLVLDMNEKRFWSETTDDDDPCSRFIPEEADTGLDKDAKKKAGAKKPAEGAAADGADGTADAEADVTQAGGFTQKKDALMQRKFEADTDVTAVLTSHQTEPQTTGRAAIYFYPNGQTERALVWIGATDKDQQSGWRPEITIELHSLGAVTYHGKPVDERDFNLLAPEAVD